MAKVFNVRAARAGGMKDEDILAFLANNPDVSANEPVGTQVPSEVRSGKLTDFLPTAGGIVGGIAGSALGPVGSIAGGAIGSGGGELVRQMFETEPIDVGRIAGETGWGLAGGVGGAVAGKLLRGAGGIAGRALTGMGDDLATRSIRPSPTAVANFGRLTKDTLPNVMRAENLVGKGADEIAEHITSVQALYDDAVMNAGTKIPANTFVSRLSEQASKLLGSNDPSVQKIGRDVFKAAQQIQAKYGAKPIDAYEVLKDRRLTDKLLPKNSFLNDPIKGGVSRILRDTEKELIDDATGGQTAEIGKRLQKLYLTQDIAEAGAGKGAGSLPFGVTQLLGANTGGSVAGLEGAVAGAATTGILNNPRVMATLSKGLSGAGSAIPRIPGASTAGMIAGQAGARSFGSIPSADIVPTQNTPELPTDIRMSGDEQTKTSSKSDKILEAIPMLMIQDIANTGGKNVPELTQLANVLKMQKEMASGGKDKPLPVESQKQRALALSGIRGITEAQELYQKDPSLLYKQLIPGQLSSRQYDSALFRAVDALMRARSGAAVPEQEVRRYMTRFAPRWGDSPEVVDFKFNQLMMDFQEVLSGVDQTRGSQMIAVGAQQN